MGICVYYPIGRCVAGDQCHNKHTGPYQPYPCKNFVFYGECKWRMECRFGHPARISAESHEPARPACKNFLSRRGCKFGSKCHSHHPVATEKGATLALPISQSTRNMPEILKTARTFNFKSAKAHPADTTIAPLRNFRSAQAFLQKPRVVSTTTDVSKDKGSTDIKLSENKPASDITMSVSLEKFRAISALSLTEPTAIMPMASETATVANVKLFKDEPVNARTISSKNFGSTPVLPQAQAIMDMPIFSETTGSADMDSSSKKPADKIPVPSIDQGSDEISQSSPALTFVSNGAINIGSSNEQPLSMSTDSTPGTPSFQMLTRASTSIGNGDNIGYVSSSDTIPLSDSSDSHDTSISTVPDDPVEPAQSDSEPIPSDGEDATKLPNSLVYESITPMSTASNFTNARPVSKVQPVVLGIPVHSFDQSVDEAPINGIDNTVPTSTDYQKAMNKPSHIVIDWSAASESCNLELSGPGMYERQISHNEILCTWAQEWNAPAIDMVNTLVHLASTWGELAIFQPIHRNMGFWHSLQITFRHRHEAAGACVSIPVTVSHHIAVQYMIPRYIIDSLGRQNLRILYQNFGQNSCQLHWNDSYRVDYSGEKLMGVTIMGTCEEQVAQCKSVLEDLIRGRVLTLEEGDNRPLWNKFFGTDEGIKWIEKTTTNVFDMKVRAAKLANLDILMVYGSIEWSRTRLGELVKKKIAELEKAAVVTAIVAEELRLMGLRIKERRV